MERVFQEQLDVGHTEIDYAQNALIEKNLQLLVCFSIGASW